MSIEQRIRDHFARLIAEGTKLSLRRGHPVPNRNEYEDECRGWMVSAEHLVVLACKNPLDAYRFQTSRICTFVPSMYSYSSDNIGVLVEILKRLFSDIENGLITSITTAASAETLDDLLDQAKEYHSRKNKEGAGILATAVFEDTMRRLARDRDIIEAGIKADHIISELEKKGVITGVMAKRCRVAAGVRNHALHAQWDQFSLEDIEDVMRLTHQLLTEHLAQ